MPKGIKGFQKGHRHSDETKKKIGDALRKQVYFNCDYCRKLASDKPSHYKKKNKHFCSMNCYSLFRKERMSFEEQHAYRGIRKPGEGKQIYHRRYAKKHPKRISHLKSRRYARERGAKGSHTFEEWKDLKKKFNSKCAICRKVKPLTKDHIIPLSGGGTDLIENIQPLCRNCNSQKWKRII